MGQIEPLALVVVVDKEPERALQGGKRTAKAATPPRQAFEVGAEIGVEALNGVGLFFVDRHDMLAAVGPDQFGIDGVSVAGVTLR